MDRQDIERWVTDVLAKHEAAAAGGGSTLFGNERVNVFAAKVKRLVEECFVNLDDVASESGDEREVRRRFKNGLDAICRWSTRVAQEEYNRAVHTYPAIQDEYKYALIRFVRVIRQGERGSVNIRVPPFDLFLFYIFQQVASSATMVSRQFFSMGYLDREVFMRESIRMALSRCVQIVGDDGEPASSGSGGAGAPPVVRHVPPPAEVLSHTVAPHDSVSNVGYAAHPRAMAPTPTPTARQGARPVAPSTVGSLVAPAPEPLEAALPRTNVVSRKAPGPFAPTREARHDKVMVIDTGDHDEEEDVGDDDDGRHEAEGDASSSATSSDGGAPAGDEAGVPCFFASTAQSWDAASDL